MILVQKLKLSCRTNTQGLLVCPIFYELRILFTKNISSNSRLPTTIIQISYSALYFSWPHLKLGVFRVTNNRLNNNNIYYPPNPKKHTKYYNFFIGATIFNLF